MDCQDQSDEVGCSEYILLKKQNQQLSVSLHIFFSPGQEMNKVSMLFRIIIEQAFLSL